jgi:GntR family transcriptional regulator, transcriptional repressor for pyruvate dehydrogenase complex
MSYDMVKPKMGGAMSGQTAEPEPAATTRPVQFGVIQNRRGFEYILEQIRAAISAGELQPGDRLPAEREMAAMFGVSRQGVREALRGLEAAGLVVCKTGVSGGSFVRQGDGTAVTRAINDLASLGTISWASIVEARILLTADTIRLACARASGDDFLALEQDIDAVEALSAERYTKERSARISVFYQLLAKSSHNDVLVTLVQSLTDIFQERMNQVAPLPKTDVVQVRRTITRLMRAGDADAAVAEITAHFKRLEAYLVEQEESRASRSPAN